MTSIQMDLSAYVRKHALSIPGKLQLVQIAFAKALEIIPRQICDNAGLDSTDILNKLRMKHARGDKWVGVDVDGPDGVRDNLDAFVWEPSLIKTNAISSAVEAACLIVSVDETVRNPQSEAVSRLDAVLIILVNSSTLRTYLGRCWPQSATRYCTTGAAGAGKGRNSPPMSSVQYSTYMKL
jgi:hypothetical protein